MKTLFFGNTLVFLVVALNNCIFLLLMILFFYHVNGDFQSIFCIVNVFYPFNRGLDTYPCIVSVFTVSMVALISGDVNSSLDILRSAPVSILYRKIDHNVNGNDDNDEAIVMMISFDQRKCQC